MSYITGIDSGPQGDGGAYDGIIARLLERITSLEEWQAAHQGLDWGNYGVNSPHPNQSIDTAEYGGGIMRLDKTGIQVKTNSADQPAIYWVSLLSGSPTSNIPYSFIQGNVGGDSTVRLQAVGTGQTAYLEVSSSTFANSGGVVVSPQLGFLGITADPTSPLFPGMYFRSDQQVWYYTGDSSPKRNLAALDMNQVYIVNTDSPYTVGANVGALKCNATSGAITVNLPSVTLTNNGTGRTIVIWKSDSSANAVTVTPNGANRIEGAATYSLAAQYKYVTLIDSGSQSGTGTWKIIGSN